MPVPTIRLQYSGTFCSADWQSAVSRIGNQLCLAYEGARRAGCEAGARFWVTCKHSERFRWCTQAFGTKRRPESAEGALPLAMVSGFFASGLAAHLLLQQFHQFLGRRPSQQIHVDQFHLPLAGTTTAEILK